jgi:hypothetical protein
MRQDVESFPKLDFKKFSKSAALHYAATCIPDIHIVQPVDDGKVGVFPQMFLEMAENTLFIRRLPLLTSSITSPVKAAY